jgi:hypothetical protein
LVIARHFGGRAIFIVGHIVRRRGGSLYVHGLFFMPAHHSLSLLRRAIISVQHWRLIFVCLEVIFHSLPNISS